MAPLTTFPPRSHSIARAGSGRTSGCPIVSTWPGRAEPLTVGCASTVSCPAETGAVLVEVALTSAYPVLAAVTVTAIGLPTKEGSTVSVGWVAPWIGTPAAFHW